MPRAVRNHGQHAPPRVPPLVWIWRSADFEEALEVTGEMGLPVSCRRDVAAELGFDEAGVHVDEDPESWPPRNPAPKGLPQSPGERRSPSPMGARTSGIAADPGAAAGEPEDGARHGGAFRLK